MPRNNIYEPLKTYFLKVNINCQGCKMKVKKTLRKVEGVYSVDIDTEQQAVIVRGNLDPEVLVKKLNRRGKHAQLMFLTPYFGNHQAGQNRSWMSTLGSNNNMINDVPSYQRHNLVNTQSDEEMMNMMKPVMMNDADYFEMNDSAEDFQELFGEVPRRGNNNNNNNYEDHVVNPNLMREMELGYSNVYPAGETMNMEIGGRGDNKMVMNERGFHGQMRNSPSLVPQSMNYEQFNARPLHQSMNHEQFNSRPVQSMNHEQFSSRPVQPMNHEQFISRPLQSMNNEQFISRPFQTMNHEQFSSRPLHGFYY